MDENEFLVWTGTLSTPELVYVESLLDQAEDQLEQILFAQSQMTEAQTVLSKVKAGVYRKPEQ